MPDQQNSSFLTDLLAGRLGSATDTASGKIGRMASALAGGAQHMIEFPGKAMEEGVTTDQAVDWAAPLAKNLVVLGAPNAMTGAAGIFGGRLAKTADLRQLSRAEDMAANMRPKEGIYKDTGWFQGPDGKWRFEIPDHKAHIPQEMWDYLETGKYGRVSALSDEVFKHPEVYEAYPRLGKIPASITKNPAAEGAFTDFPHPYIEAQGPTKRATRSPFLHEQQHAVQELEGFAPGTSDEAQLALLYQRNPYLRGQPGNMDKAFTNYLSAAGEAEARNVQARQFMDKSERRIMPPWATTDIPNQNLSLEYFNPKDRYFYNKKASVE